MAEFCRFGLSGARIDRIAERGSVNKRMIYHYFGDKVGLFDAAVGACLGGSDGECSPAIKPDDALGHKEPLTDQVVWMLFWAHLERPEALGAGLADSVLTQNQPLDYALACMRITQVLLPGLASAGADLAAKVQTLGKMAGHNTKPRIKLKPRLQAASERKT